MKHKGENFINFSGTRAKKDGTTYEDVIASLNANEVVSVVLVDNRSKYPCNVCEQKEQCEEENCFEDCITLDDWSSDAEINHSFIEIETERHIYTISIAHQFNDDEWKWYREIFKAIRDGDSIDVEKFLMKKRAQRDQEGHDRWLQQRIGRYVQRMRLRETCVKACRARMEDGTCYLGFKCLDGKPQEPCITVTAKSELDSVKELIHEHIMTRENKTD